MSNKKFLLYTLMHCHHITSDNFINLVAIFSGLENAQKLVTEQIKSEEKVYKLDGFVCILS